MTDYFVRALVAGAVTGALCGVVGVLIHLRKRAFFATALTHASFPGGIAAALVGVNVSFGAGVFGLLLVALMVALSRLTRQGRNVAAGVVLTLGYALGMAMPALSPGHAVRVDSFLTGSILSIPEGNLIALGALLGVVVLAGVFAWRPLLFSSYDPAGFTASGGRERLTDGLVLTLIALTVILAMPAIGSIIAIAMLAAPAAAAARITRTVGTMVVCSVVLGVTAAVGGLLASRAFDLAAGAAMALVATALYLVAIVLGAIRRGAARTAVSR